MFLDAFVLLNIAKGASELSSRLPVKLWTAFLVALPFFLGMAASVRTNTIQVIRSPVRALLEKGLTAAMLIIYLGVQSAEGLAWAYWGLFGVTVLAYSFGRLCGLAFRALWVLGLLLVVVYWIR